MKTLTSPFLAIHRNHYRFLRLDSIRGRKSSFRIQKVQSLKETNSLAVRQNLSFKGAAVRSAGVITLPLISALDWTCGLHLFYYAAPVVLYIVTTGFSMICPLKAWIQNEKTSL